ncbi:MAG: M23 family metallopeptidase [Dehalococcoidia bacterium]
MTHTTPSRRGFLTRVIPAAGLLALGAGAASAQLQFLGLTLPLTPTPQGGSFVAIVQGADITDLQVTFAGRTAQGVADGGGWLAFVGVGQRVGRTAQQEPGVYPVQARVTLAGGGERTLGGEVTVAATRFPVEEIVLGPSESALLDPSLTQRELAILTPIYDGFTPQRLWDGFFQRPAEGAITDVFGSRRSYNGGPATGSHSGVDFGAGAGAPVVAAAAGRVALAQALPVRGNGVVVDHGAGVFTGYFHLSAIGVEVGQAVRAGERLGRVGATGLVTGPHLHWEVAVGGFQVDGLGWLPEAFARAPLTG